MLVALKLVGAAFVFTVGLLFESGEYALALAAVPTLVTIFVVTRSHARRRARERARR